MRGAKLTPADKLQMGLFTVRKMQEHVAEEVAAGVAPHLAIRRAAFHHAPLGTCPWFSEFKKILHKWIKEGKLPSSVDPSYLPVWRSGR